MPPEITALIAFCGVTLTTIGGVIGHAVADRRSKREAKVDAVVADTNAQDRLIDQLQEELGRYRERTDARLDHLEAENRGYRAFIGIQRDHMAAHGIPLPDWPEGLPR